MLRLKLPFAGAVVIERTIRAIVGEVSMINLIRFAVGLTALAATVSLPVVAAETLATVPAHDSRSGGQSAHAILERYVEAWRGPREMAYDREIRFGVRVSGEDGGEFVIVLPPAGGASLTPEAPAETLPILVCDIETLRRIDRGEISALTAMARAKWSDRTPLDVRLPEGFRWTPENRGVFLPLMFHFFVRGEPEVTRFGEEASRFVHGGNSSIIYYDRGLRTAWYQLRDGMHVNSDPSDQTNPFPSLFIVIRGSIQSRIGGIERDLREGEAVLAPAGAAHEFWVDEKGYGEFILVMFGEGA
jgi:mannose-6-phosphate isomerase-like protein (cupin superfamily)